MILRIFTTLVFMQLSVLLFSQNFIKGVVTDADNGESVIGCNILLQGTTIGTVTDFDGNYELKNVPAGTYNIIFSFISYDKSIQKVEIGKNSELKLDVKLKSSTQVIQDVVVTAQRRTDTELTMLTSTRKSLTIANGITSQQIARSQDKDASEVIRRVPGVTIREGKFVIVRGLTERYNSVWLNSSSTPSSESDVRAFSFDVIPSGQIDNILIYKTPAPELPADFAGAMINVKTKSLIDRNSISVSASVGYNQLSTGKTFYTSEGSKTDWLGYDKTVRVIPSTVPATNDFKKLFEQINNDKIAQINSISKSFNSIMTPYKTIAKPDADLQLGFNKRFAVGDISIGTITALGYSSSFTNENSFRAAYNPIQDIANPDTAFSNYQNSYSSKVRLSALSNWTFTFSDNQRIEFRNIINNNGVSKTVLKQGCSDYSNQVFERSIELGYESRFTLSSQLSGFHKFNSEKTLIDWTLGYSFANKNQPDLRRLKTIVGDRDADSKYFTPLSAAVAPDYAGRLFFRNKEDIINGSINISQKVNIGSFIPELKAGLFMEKKTRDFTSKIYGYSTNQGNGFPRISVNSFNKTEAFNSDMFTSINEIFNSKIDYLTGMHIKESSNASDNYDASNQLFATYFAVNLPIAKWINTYIGVRLEKNNLQLNGFKFSGGNNEPIAVKIDTVDVFPSMNTTLNLSEDFLIRLSGGRTINRPEFREISPFIFTSFEENTTIYGNENVKNCYVNNFDTRFEWYPTKEEIVSVGVFYKSFENPIESKIKYVGSGWNYTFDNAPNATAFGLEIDARKRLHEFEKSTSFKFLSNLTFMFNASVIKSSIKTNPVTDGESERTLQGQSPYIINIGTSYNDSESGIMVSAMYNKAGKRISSVGDAIAAHIYEMPFNSLDLTIEKKIFKLVNVKLGVKNLLDDDVVFQRYQKYAQDGQTNTIVQVTNKHKIGRLFKLGVSVIL